MKKNQFFSKVKQLSGVCVRVLKRHKNEYQTVFSARNDKQDEVIDEIDLYFSLDVVQKYSQSDFDNFDIRSQLGKQIPNREMNQSGWRFDRSYSVTIYFQKTIKKNG